MRALLLSVVMLALSCAPDAQANGPATVAELDLKQLEGTWYDVADFPQRFQQSCHCTEASYVLNPFGEVSVRNRCRQGGPGGFPIQILGRARRPDPDEQGKLEVSFFPFLWGPYWVIERGDGYEYLVVSNDTRSTLWILGRTRTLDRALFDGILQRLEERGFDLGRLERGIQDGCGR